MHIEDSLLLEVVGILRPRLLLLQSLLLGGVILVVCVAAYVLNVVFQLPPLLCACRVCHSNTTNALPETTPPVTCLHQMIIYGTLEAIYMPRCGQAATLPGRISRRSVTIWNSAKSLNRRPGNAG